MIRRLTDAEQARYNHVPSALHRRVRIVTVGVLPPGAQGMTIGRLIFVRRDDNRDGTRALLAHELVHVHQYAQLGTVRFLSRYLATYLRFRRNHMTHRAAYLALPAEVEARQKTHRWQQQLHE